MKDNFDLYFNNTLDEEGRVYEDVPGDNGGPTKFGVTIADVARYNSVRLPERGGPGWDELVEKVKALDQATASVIYKRYYWDDCRCDELPSGVDYCVADYGLNSGPGRAVPVLGDILNIPGHTVTDAMITALHDLVEADVINAYQDARHTFLDHISQYPHNQKFRKDWLARVERVRKIALGLDATAEGIV